MKIVFTEKSKIIVGAILGAFCVVLVAGIIFKYNLKSTQTSALNEGADDIKKIITEQNYPFCNYKNEIKTITISKDDLCAVFKKLFEDSGALEECKINISNDKVIDIVGNIGDISKICEANENLAKYQSVLKLAKGKEVKAKIKINKGENGNAVPSIEKASIASFSIENSAIESLLTSNNKFMEFFTINYDNIKFENDKITISGQIPDIFKDYQ